jgi:hypothetical protein
LVFAQTALSVAQQVLPPRASKFAPGIFTQPQLLACLLIKEYLHLDYRATEELLSLSDGLREALSLSRAPDHSMLWWFMRHRLTAEIVQNALKETVRRVEPAVPPREGNCRADRPLRLVALDSTGLWLSYSSRYFQWRAKRERGQRGWLKWAIALWVGPQMVLAQRVRPGPCGDFADLVPLAAAAHDTLSFDRLLADAGYDSEANHRFCREELGVHSLIKAKSRRSKTVIARTPYRSEMCQVLDAENGDAELLTAYRQRWKVETVMSVTKRMLGEALSSRRDEMQERQALLRGVVYNLHRLALFGWVWIGRPPAIASKLSS